VNNVEEERRLNTMRTGDADLRF